MPSTYPNTLDSFPITRADGTAMAATHAADHNNENDAINKIEAELGLLPKGTFATVRARLDALVPTFSVKTYGAVGDGTTDDTLAIQAAIDAASAGNGGEVYIPPGIYYLNRSGTLSLLIAKNLVGLRIYGAGKSSVIKLSANTSTAFSFNKTADYDTCQNVIFENFDVDANSIAAASQNQAHVIFGTIAKNGVVMQRVNFNNITVRNVNTRNVDVTRSNFQINTQHALGGETQTVITNIAVEDCVFSGGCYGAACIGYTPDASADKQLNVYIDDIYFLNLTHDTNIVPAAFQAHAHFHVGSYGHGDRVTIENCIGRNSADVGIEVNGMRQVNILNCRMETTHGFPYLFVNHRSISRLKEQVVFVNNCAAQRIDANQHVVDNANSSFTILGQITSPAGSANGKFPFGSFFGYGLRYYSNVGQFTSLPDAARNDAFYAEGDVRHISIHGAQFELEGLTCTDATGYNVFPIRLFTLLNKTTVQLRNIDVRISGSQGSTGQISTWGIFVTGPTASSVGDLTLDIDNCTLESSMTTQTSFAARLIEVNYGTVKGSISRIRCISTAGTSIRGVQIASSTTLTITTRLIVRDIYTDEVASLSAGVFVGDVTNQLKVSYQNLRPTAPVYSTSITPNLANGNIFTIVATNGTAFTINAPSAFYDTGQTITVDIKNSSGGALGVITWASPFLLAGAFTNPANTKRRTISFYYDGTSWVETNRAAADI